jgi:hypothetical protein
VRYSLFSFVNKGRNLSISNQDSNGSKMAEAVFTKTF